ncbi:MAG: Tripartite tricarboxylate transporter TctA family [uncultured Solirubrobacteraceae bacterium]|uniref:Tripartite tricarboxylate transporter TctA family n=1 Tax=uncultured Solirubrobacteraceae bacterium TaxID=1162706 RepID=A0A6J4SBG6_9ACTN|nr:MAG: Tripartite tricarboxylate transporter TctA family [uncultured Solirubrobacteraceae bacterium]
MTDYLGELAGSMGEGLSLLLTPSTMLILVLGIVVGLVIGILPGLGGLATMALLLPFAYALEPANALALILGAYSAVSMGGSIPAILLNTPGTGEQAVTALDGYPLTRQGKGARALGAAAAAGAIGTLVGVVALILLIPVIRTILIAVGSAELFALSLLGVLSIGVLTTDSVTRGLLSGLLGLMLSFIGFDPITGTPRFTGGSLYLYDGLSITALTLGLFAVSEMIFLFSKGKAISSSAGQDFKFSKAEGASVGDGVRDCLRHRRTLVEGGLIGSIVGTVPGMGGTVAMFLSYAQAKQRSRNSSEFGKGSVEGIIAAESANNSKEGGSLIPTLAFGIPGSSGMAIFIGILLIVGLQPGPELMRENLPMVYYMAWSLAVAGILGSILGLLIAPHVARAATVRPEILAPVLIAFSVAGSVVDTRLVFGAMVAIAAGFVGYWLRLVGYSPAGITLGFLLGPIVEKEMFISLRAYGFDFLTRPLTLFLFALMAYLIARPYLRRVWARRRQRTKEPV